MVSKIDNSTPGALRRVDSTRGEGVDKRHTSAAAETGRPAPTGSASLLARASELAAQAPEIDQARVDSIKEAIARGEYRVDPEATVRAFIAMELS